MNIPEYAYIPRNLTHTPQAQNLYTLQTLAWYPLLSGLLQSPTLNPLEEPSCYSLRKLLVPLTVRNRQTTQTHTHTQADNIPTDNVHSYDTGQVTLHVSYGDMQLDHKNKNLKTKRFKQIHKL